MGNLKLYLCSKLAETAEIALHRQIVMRIRSDKYRYYT